ncbi:MAG TPA: hypothetical protein VEC35_04950 [Noviherbaspirillum sp.]|nr:hypothetical protein [Noviherbaspirillum sp.]
MSRTPTNYPKFGAIIPAYPGFHVLDVAYRKDDSVEPSRHPIVAWALTADEFLIPYPVTLEGVQIDCCYILQPDGTVERPGIDRSDNVEAWLCGLGLCSSKANKQSDGGKTPDQSCQGTQDDVARD